MALKLSQLVPLGAALALDDLLWTSDIDNLAQSFSSRPQDVLDLLSGAATSTAGVLSITAGAIGATELADEAYTTAEQTKLAGIEALATADQTGAQIKAAYEVEPSAFTDAQFTKLAAIAAGANLYVHPNHSGDVHSAADGATTIQPLAVALSMIALGAVAGSAVSRVAGSTYSTVQDVQDQFHSSGVISGGILSDAGSGNIAVTAGTGAIRATDDANAEILFCDFGALGSTAIPVSSRRHVGVIYNAGSPQIEVRILDDWNHQTEFPLGEVYRDAGTNLHLTVSGLAVNDHASRMALRSRQTMPLARDARGGGLILGETGTRNVTMTAGALWDFLNRFALGAIDTSAADTFTTYYDDGAGGWTRTTGQTQWSNTLYDDGSGVLATLSNNRYGIHWVYVGLDGDVSLVYGTTNLNSLGGAEDEPVPASVPPEFEHHARLIGRLIFLKSAGTATLVESAFETLFSGATITDHGDLAGLSDNDHPQYQLATLADGQTWYGATGVQTMQNNFGATAAPDPLTDDITLGYVPGSRWVDITNDKAYICLDNTNAAAVWTEITQAGGGGGAASTADLNSYYTSFQMGLGGASGTFEFLLWHNDTGGNVTLSSIELIPSQRTIASDATDNQKVSSYNTVAGTDPVSGSALQATTPKTTNGDEWDEGTKWDLGCDQNLVIANGSSIYALITFDVDMNTQIRQTMGFLLNFA